MECFIRVTKEDLGLNANGKNGERGCWNRSFKEEKFVVFTSEELDLSKRGQIKKGVT